MKQFFEGWYCKHQYNDNVLAVIPGRSSDAAFIQVLTKTEVHKIIYRYDQYSKSQDGKIIHIDTNRFSVEGMKLDIQQPEIKIVGEIEYTDPTPLQSDIMGFFKYFPMECRHGIISLHHHLRGKVEINGNLLDFDGGIGYMEFDSGRSFPQKYTWVQCNDFSLPCTIMISIARVPFAGLSFWGCIAVVWLNGKEYRLATYNGGKIRSFQKDRIELSQGKYRIIVTIVPKNGQMLDAPEKGLMSRTICESISCSAKFLFLYGHKILFEGKSENVSHEYVD